jgi:DamX protein
MRCRLIEQLFANTLFDPEKSLAVSLLNLSQKSKDNITIVVEHAHSLSMQIKYELCQLVDVANKTHGKINVALFGQEKSAQDAANNKSIFKNKLVVLDAKSGQLLPLDHEKFRNDNSIFTQKFWLKFFAAVATVCILIGLSWFVLIEHDNFSFSKLSNMPASSLAKKPLELNETTLISNDETVLPKQNELASSNDIYAAIQGEAFAVKSDENKQAQTADILQALHLSVLETVPPTNEMVKEIIVEPVPTTEIKIIELAEKPKLMKAAITSKEITIPEKLQKETTLGAEVESNYYFEFSAGFVIQIVAFTDKALLTRFIEQYPGLEYHSYQKSLNDKMLNVLTTKVFEDREQARVALQNLPQTIIDRGVWIKELSIIQREINPS